MRFFSSSLSSSDAYKLLTGVVVPRPIAWVTTLSATGKLNLAPFSTFTMLSNDPPIVGFNVGLKGGHKKDTLQNIADTGEFVVNIPSYEHMESVHESAEEYGRDISEVKSLGLESIDSESISVPGLKAVMIRLECVLYRLSNYGEAGSTFVAGEVQVFHVRDEALDRNKISTEMIDPLMRLAGPSYGGIDRIKTLAPNRLSSPA